MVLIIVSEKEIDCAASVGRHQHCTPQPGATRLDRGLVARDGAHPEENSAEGEDAGHAPEVVVIDMLVKQPWRHCPASSLVGCWSRNSPSLTLCLGCPTFCGMSTDRCTLPLERAFPIAGT